MLSIQIDEREAKELYLKKLNEQIEQMDLEKVFWDTSELKRRTCLSWNTIQKEFFFNPHFPKRKVGGKWLFPAKETKDFLLVWLDEQPTN